MAEYDSRRTLWTPPSVLDKDDDSMRRQVIAALQGIYKELTDGTSSKVVVPLQGSSLALAAGQIVIGVANGQALLLPSIAPDGSVREISIIIDTVKSAVTVVHPDKTVDTLSTIGLYIYSMAAGGTRWQTIPTGGGSGGGLTQQQIRRLLTFRAGF